MKKADSPKPLDQALEKIGQLSRVQRILVAVGLCVACIGLAIWLAYLPKFQAMTQLGGEISDLDGKLANATKDAQRFAQVKADKEALELQYREGLLLLPDTKEIPSLLDAIAQSGRESSLDFNMFKPGDEVAGKTFAEMPVTIEVIGGYHNIASFFGKMANLSRLVNVKDIKISPVTKTGGPFTLMASMNAVTYRFVEPTDNSADGSKSADKAKEDASKKSS